MEERPKKADDAYKAHAAQTSESIAMVRSALSTTVAMSAGASAGGASGAPGKAQWTLDNDKRLMSIEKISGTEGVGPINEW